MFPAIRLVLAIGGTILFAVGLLLLTVGGPAAAAGLWPLITGGVLIVAVILERQRYRSEAAERSADPVGLGGGEPGPLPPRFRPTEERFIDPTTGRTMRVHADPQTGERRYLAEMGPESGHGRG